MFDVSILLSGKLMKLQKAASGCQVLHMAVRACANKRVRFDAHDGAGQFAYGFDT